MLFRALTLIASLITIFSAHGSYFSTSLNYLSSMEGSVTDYYQLTSDNAFQIQFSPIKSIIYTDSGLKREEQYAGDALGDPVLSRLEISNWMRPSGLLQINEHGSLEMSYRQHMVNIPFDVNFGKIVVEEEDANQYLLELYRAKFESLIQKQDHDYLSRPKLLSSRSVIHDLWIGQVNCTHIVDQWVKEVGHIDRGLSCTTEFIFEYSSSLL